MRTPGSESSRSLTHNGTVTFGPGWMCMTALTACRRTVSSESFNNSTRAATAGFAGVPISPSEEAAWGRTLAEPSFSSSVSGATASAACGPRAPNSSIVRSRTASSEDSSLLISAPVGTSSAYRLGCPAQGTPTRSPIRRFLSDSCSNSYGSDSRLGPRMRLQCPHSRPLSRSPARGVMLIQFSFRCRVRHALQKSSAGNVIGRRHLSNLGLQRIEHGIDRLANLRLVGVA